MICFFKKKKSFLFDYFLVRFKFPRKKRLVFFFLNQKINLQVIILDEYIKMQGPLLAPLVTCPANLGKQLTFYLFLCLYNTNDSVDITFFQSIFQTLEWKLLNILPALFPAPT